MTPARSPADDAVSAAQAAVRPPAWIYTGVLGRASEVWLWRQVVGLRQVDPIVVAKAYENQNLYETGRVPVHLRPPVEPRRSRLGFLVDRLANAPLGGHRGRIRDARWLAARFRRDRPAVILAHYAWSAIAILPMARHFRVPVVAHGNGADMSGMLRGEDFRRKLLASLQHLAGFVVVAQYMADWLLEHGMPRERVHLIPYGAPMEQFQPAECVGDQPCRFLAVGRFTPKKRPDLTLRAFARCVERCPDASLRMIGDGEMRADCESLARELGVGDRVAFLGVQPNEVVRAELRRASAFVQHSVTAENGDREGWPVSIAEAAATGLPVVSTRHAGIPQQVDSGSTGFLVGESDLDGMAERMIELAENPDLRVEMGRAARERMRQFDTPRQVAKLDDLLMKTATSGAR